MTYKWSFICHPNSLLSSNLLLCSPPKQGHSENEEWNLVVVFQGLNWRWEQLFPKCCGFFFFSTSIIFAILPVRVLKWGECKWHVQSHTAHKCITSNEANLDLSTIAMPRVQGWKADTYYIWLGIPTYTSMDSHQWSILIQLILILCPDGGGECKEYLELWSHLPLANHPNLP